MPGKVEKSNFGWIDVITTMVLVHPAFGLSTEPFNLCSLCITDIPEAA